MMHTEASQSRAAAPRVDGHPVTGRVSRLGRCAWPTAWARATGVRRAGRRPGPGVTAARPGSGIPRGRRATGG